MGQLGKRLAGGSQDIVKGLLRAYADEWFAHYNYQFVANTLRGHRAPDVITLLRRRSALALERATRLPSD